MSDVEAFLRDSAAIAGVTTEDVLAKVFHAGDDALAPLVSGMDETSKSIVTRLDRELRIRNPGLHYVMRKMYVGYRREGSASTPLGERSQIFASIVRSTSRVEVVLPVDPDRIGSTQHTKDLRGIGHHGIGEVKVTLSNGSDLDRFLSDFDYWLTQR